MWTLACGLFVVLAFAPLIVSGVFVDFLQGLRIAMHGGPHGNTTRGGAPSAFLGQLVDWRLDAILAVLLVLTLQGTLGLRKMAQTWLLALVGALVYW